MRAFVLLNVRAGKCPQVVGELRKIEEVISANACWGRPDIFTVVEVPSQSELAKIILMRIQVIDGVESTDTHIAVEEPGSSTF